MPKTVLAVIAILAASAVPCLGQGLFVEAPASASLAPAAPSLAVVRSRTVRVRLGLIPGGSSREAARGLLPPPGHRLTLDLFDDVVVRARMTRSSRQGRALVWAGKIEGEPVGDVVLAVVDGVLSASVVWPGGAYRVRYDGATHVVEQIDHALFPEGGCYREVPVGAGSAREAPAVANDDGSLIDVLVVYTPAARDAAGGTSGMLSQINLAVAETNAGYANSNIVQRMRLAGTAEVSYTESGDISVDLDHVTDPSDGYMDGVPGLRNTYRADLVSLITSTPSSPYCGVAWLMSGNDPGFAPNAYGVVELACMTGYYSFGHETGHNMGLNHARSDYTSVPTGAYPYSFGYKDPANLFRTVMAYNCPVVGCPRVLYFSNPNVTYGGNPTGIDAGSSSSAYNAMSLNNTRVTVANWRPTPTLTLLQPNGGESWPAGTTHSITWSGTGLPAGSVVNITYSDGSGRGFVTNSTAGGAIAAVPATQGSYAWTVPDNSGSDWRVTVCLRAPTVPVRRGGGSPACLASDTSDASFSIVP